MRFSDGFDVEVNCGEEGMLSKRISFWLIPLLIGGFIVWIILLCPSLYARYLLYELKNIQLNHSTFEDAQRFAKKIKAQERPFVKCTSSECQWYKLTDNALLPRWYRGKGVTLTIALTVKGSKVTEKDVEYSVGVGMPTVGEASTGRPRIVVSQAESWFQWQKEKQLKLQKMSHENPTAIEEQTFSKDWEEVWYDKNGKIAVDAFVVHISPRSKSIVEDWKKYTAFNYRCFWKYKGCKDARELLPTADPLPENMLGKQIQ